MKQTIENMSIVATNEKAVTGNANALCATKRFITAKIMIADYRQKGNQMDEIKSGMKIAYQGVKEEMETIVAELARKGIEKPKGFSALEQFIKDRLSECE